MAYGTVKVDNITFDNGGSDQNVTVSGLYNSLTSGVSVTGTISGSVVIGSTSVSGTTVQGVSGTFTSLTGTTITGTTINAVTVASTTGTFTSLTGTTITGTTIDGVTVTATTGSFTSLTGTTTSGTTANFVSGVFTTQVSGTTVTGTTSSFTSGNFTTLSGATATFTSGVLALGTATNPSLSFASDPNTGIYSPGADQVAISTNGTGRLFVDSSGKVEVSKATGSATLSPTELFISSTTDASDWNTTNPWARLAFYSADTTNGARTRVAIDAVQQFSNGNVSALSFKTDNGSGTLVERQRISYTGTTTLTSAASTEPLIVKIDASEVARIDSNGRLGLGTISPSNTAGFSQQLEVAGNLPCVSISNTGTGANKYSLGVNSVGAFGVWDNTASAYRMYINSSGSVGIGTTSPGSPLTIESNAGNQVKITYPSVVSYFLNATSGGDFAINKDGTERVRIDSSGRLLVGTSTELTGSTSSLAKLQVSANTFNNGQGIFSIASGSNRSVIGDGSTVGEIFFADNAAAEYAKISCVGDGASSGSGDTPGRLVFSTTADGASSPTERMRIKNDGTINMPGVYSLTTASAANVFVASDGDLARSTSSSKYKANIETLEDNYSDALLACRPVWYQSTCDKDNPNWGWWGFIAEEVAAIDPRLVHWKTVEVTYDEKGSAVSTPCDPEPEGVAYDRFVPHLLNLIKRQGEAIAELQAEVAALKGA